jgi:aspartate aminotransferase
VENFGAFLKVVDTREDFQLDMGAIERALNPRTRAVLINSPNNPTARSTRKRA